MSIHDAVLQPAAATATLAIAADDDATIAATTGLRLVGYSVKETAGTPAVAEGFIVNGATGAAAGKVACIGLAASTSHTVDLGAGIACPLGLSIDHISGTFDVVLYTIVV